MQTQPTIGLPNEFLKEGAIPQSPLALQAPPKAVVPEDKPLTSVSSDNLVQDIGKSVGQFQEEQTRMEELQGQITSVKDKIIETEKLKAEALKKEEADRKAGELSQEEKTAFGVVDNKEDPVLTELQQQQTQINTDFTNVQNELEVLKTGMSVAQSNLIGSIQDTFDVRRKAMEDVNQREQVMYQTLGIRLGTQRYSPLTTTGILSTSERQGIMRLAELDALEKSTIVQAQLAYNQQEFEIVYDKMQMLNDQREEVNNKVFELQKIAKERNAEIQERQDVIRKQAGIIDMIKQGQTSVVDIFEKMGGAVNLQEINETFDAVLADEIQLNEKALTAYTDIDGNRVQPFYDNETGQVREVKLGKVKTQTTPIEKAKIGDLTGLKKDFEKGQEVKDFLQINNKLQVLQAAQREAKTTDNFVAVDQAIITLFNKITDPTSVVRESEYARTSTDLGILNRLKGKMAKLLEGGAGLTPSDRDAIERMAMNFQEIAAKNYERKRREFTAIAEEYNIKPEFVVGEDILAKSEQTLEELAQTKGFDLEGARKEATDEEIKAFLEQ